MKPGASAAQDGITTGGAAARGLRPARVPGTILVVDDDERVRSLLTRLLELAGHVALSAASGMEALATLQARPVDLLLVDLMMPVMSGIDVLVELKGSPQLHTIPVIVVSAYSDMEQIAACLRLGADDYLVKPFNSVFLEARVGACLERLRLRAQEQAYRLELEARVGDRTALAELRAAELERSERELRRQSTILQSILASMGDGVLVVDMEGRLVHHNPAVIAILGQAFEGLVPALAAPEPPFFRQDQATRFLPDQLPLAQAIAGRPSDGMELYLPAPADGAGRWLSVTARPIEEPGGALSGAVAVVRDITGRKAVEHRLMHDALHDSLTGLPNRALFYSRLSHALERARRDPELHFAVLFLDLDRLKTINDTLGHEAGDELLVAVAQRVKGCLRLVDTVARLGGDEFTVLLDGIVDSQAAILAAWRIQTAVAAPMHIGGHTLTVTASIGVALSDPSYSAPAELVRDADIAMYHAKMAGRSRVGLFDPLHHTTVVSRSGSDDTN